MSDGLGDGIVAIGELDGSVWHGGRTQKDRGVIWMKIPSYYVVEALREVQGAASGPKEAFPHLCLLLHARCSICGAIVLAEHFGKAEVKDVGDVVYKPITRAAVGYGLGRVAELGAVAV
jgi:hypothetical protein